jgi:hypothetical protein
MDSFCIHGPQNQQITEEIDRIIEEKQQIKLIFIVRNALICTITGLCGLAKIGEAQDSLSRSKKYTSFECKWNLDRKSTMYKKNQYEV